MIDFLDSQAVRSDEEQMSAADKEAYERYLDELHADEAYAQHQFNKLMVNIGAF